jgi:hypothetical protein
MADKLERLEKEKLELHDTVSFIYAFRMTNLQECKVIVQPWVILRVVSVDGEYVNLSTKGLEIKNIRMAYLRRVEGMVLPI